MEEKNQTVFRYKCRYCNTYQFFLIIGKLHKDIPDYNIIECPHCGERWWIHKDRDVEYI